MLRHPVCRAIETRTVLIFTYHGEEREVEPHILGITHGGKPVLSGWQRSGGLPGWRNFLLSEIEELTRTAIRFTAPRSGYNPGDAAFDRIVSRIEPPLAAGRASA